MKKSGRINSNCPTLFVAILSSRVEHRIVFGVEIISNVHSVGCFGIQEFLVSWLERKNFCHCRCTAIVVVGSHVHRVQLLKNP
jgi:hypothetical protein